MGQYEWGHQAGHTNAVGHETVVHVAAIVEDGKVVAEVAGVVADDVAQFEIDVADEYYCYQAPVAEQTAEVEKLRQLHEKMTVEWIAWAERQR
jgi:hypothetical protein